MTVEKTRATIIPAAAGFSILRFSDARDVDDHDRLERNPVTAWYIEESNVRLAICATKTFDITKPRGPVINFPYGGHAVVLQAPDGSISCTITPEKQWKDEDQWLALEFGFTFSPGPDGER